MRACIHLKARGPEPGPAVIRAGNHFAVLCLFLGAALAAFVSGSFAQRIGNFLSVGLIPAVGFYVGGNVLGQLLIFGVELCDMIIARCSRYVVGLAKRSLALGRHAYIELVHRGQPDQTISAELKPRNPFWNQAPDYALREGDLHHIKLDQPNPAMNFGRDPHWVAFDHYWPTLDRGWFRLARCVRLLLGT